MLTRDEMWIGVLAGAVALLALSLLLTALVAYLRLRASRPLLEGCVDVDGASGAIRVDRDEAGIPRIAADDRRDAAFGLGFLHSQERFFQMDLMRRAAAGELAELFGKPLVTVDRRFRIHGFRGLAREAMNDLDEAARGVLRSYARGVNAGLRSLRAAPFEYFLTRTTPSPWLEDDSLLVVYYMYILLQDSNAEQDYNLFLLNDVLPAEVAEFLAPAGVAEWDAPLMGDALIDPPLPLPHTLDLRGILSRQSARPARPAGTAPAFRGSNAWAVGGGRTAHGSAIVANDMHLALGMPNVFFRATLAYRNGEARELSGVTLPGFPAMIAGTNGRIAWGFSNSGADTVDLVRLDQSGVPQTYYRAADCVHAIELRSETIRVRGGGAVHMEAPWTRWGPVIRTTRGGARFAQRWIAHRRGAVNLGLLHLENADTAEEALAVAGSVGIPAQNLIVGDAGGNVGWTIAGILPRRRSGGDPTSSADPDADASWREILPAEDYPRVLRGGDAKVWSANARVVGGEDVNLLGRGYYLLGARARMIRDGLDGLGAVDEAAMMRLQMNHDAVFLQRWRDLLLATLDGGDPARDRRWIEASRWVRDWGGRASSDSVGYRLVREFRDAVELLAFEPFISAVQARHPEFSYELATDQREGPLWRLVSMRPAHLLNSRFASWDELLGAAVDTVCAHACARGRRMAQYRWGRRNELRMAHPMSRFFPLMGRLYDMAPVPLDGDVHMPLAQDATHGPVMRMSVAPGREREGCLHIPGGQAGNPLSPYYGRGQEDWLAGAPTPLLPGRPRYTLQLRGNGLQGDLR